MPSTLLRNSKPLTSWNTTAGWSLLGRIELSGRSSYWYCYIRLSPALEAAPRPTRQFLNNEKQGPRAWNMPQAIEAELLLSPFRQSDSCSNAAPTRCSSSKTTFPSRMHFLSLISTSISSRSLYFTKNGTLWQPKSFLSMLHSHLYFTALRLL